MRHGENHVRLQALHTGIILLFDSTADLKLCGWGESTDSIWSAAVAVGYRSVQQRQRKVMSGRYHNLEGKLSLRTYRKLLYILVVIAQYILGLLPLFMLIALTIAKRRNIGVIFVIMPRLIWTPPSAYRDKSGPAP